MLTNERGAVFYTLTCVIRGLYTYTMGNKMITGKGNGQKGGYRGGHMWSAHRLEGAVKNSGIKSAKKQKKMSI